MLIEMFLCYCDYKRIICYFNSINCLIITATLLGVIYKNYPTVLA